MAVSEHEIAALLAERSRSARLAAGLPGQPVLADLRDLVAETGAKYALPVIRETLLTEHTAFGVVSAWEADQLLLQLYDPGQPRHPKGDPRGGQWRGMSAEGYPFVESRLAPQSIHVKPGLQYKESEITDKENAVGDQLKHIQVYDQATAGPLTVWQSNDGNVYVINGHHRRELALRTGIASVPVRIFSESDGVTFDVARALGALQNLRDGKGTAIDAAYVLRDLGFSREELEATGVNLRHGTGKDAMSFLKLSPEALAYVKQGDVNEYAAAGIADANLAPAAQMLALQKAAEAGLTSREHGEAMGQKMARSKLIQVDDGTGNLFGDVVFDVPWAEQAKIQVAIARRLRADKSAYEAMTRGLVAGDTYVDTEAQIDAAMAQHAAASAIDTSKRIQAAIEQGAEELAKKPTRSMLDKIVSRVIDVAREVGNERLEKIAAGRTDFELSEADLATKKGGGGEQQPYDEATGRYSNNPGARSGEQDAGADTSAHSSAQVSFEVVPSTKSPHDRDIHTMPKAKVHTLTEAVMADLQASGLVEALGGSILDGAIGPGWWEGVSNPAAQVTVTGLDYEALEYLAATIGQTLNQDGVGFHTIDGAAESYADANLISIDLSETLSTEDMASIAGSAQKAFGELWAKVAFIASENELRILNLGGLPGEALEGWVESEAGLVEVLGDRVMSKDLLRATPGFADASYYHATIERFSSKAGESGKGEAVTAAANRFHAAARASLEARRNGQGGARGSAEGREASEVDEDSG